MNRRGLFLGAAALLAAPSIVRVSSLMPVSVRKLPGPWLPLNSISFAPGVVNPSGLAAYTMAAREGLWVIAWGGQLQEWRYDHARRSYRPLDVARAS